MALSLPGMGQPEPVNGERIHVTVTLDGQPVIEASLTLLWFRTKYAGDPHFLPIYFLPIPLAEDGTPEPNTYPPVHVALSLNVLPDGYSPWPGQPTPTPEPFWPATGDVQLPEPSAGLYADKCEECTTGVSCQDAGRCLFEG